jgi:carbon storage regulator
MRESFTLVLTRRIGEEIVIADDIRVKVLAINGQKVRLGILAAPSICVDREEVHARRRAEGVLLDATSLEPTAAEGAS